MTDSNADLSRELFALRARANRLRDAAHTANMILDSTFGDGNNERVARSVRQVTFVLDNTVTADALSIGKRDSNDGSSPHLLDGPSTEDDWRTFNA